jgi:hypothetical protein
MIDTTFDFRAESGTKDTDSASPTLRSYHRILWSKPLPSVGELKLREDPKSYLVATTPFGDMRLTSDSITNSMARHRALHKIISKVPDGLIAEVKSLGSTIGSRIVFPGDQIDGGKTINVLRGFNVNIRDRFDLTLECIRRHYSSEQNVLSTVLNRYGQFFSLFESFDGYVEFFLLQDLVNKGKVQFLTDIDSSQGRRPYPKTVAEYGLYANRTIEFVVQRNKRIDSWIRVQETSGEK